MKLRAILVLSVLVTPLAAADWPMFRKDERHQARATGDFAPFEDVWWNVKAPNATQVEASPVIAEDIVIVADWLGRVRALDLETGDTKWWHNVTTGTGRSVQPTKIVATPAIAGGRVYVTTTSGILRSLDLTTGVKLAEAAVGETLAPPTIHEGKLFIGNEAGEMQAFDTQTLTMLWKFTTAIGAFNGNEGGCVWSTQAAAHAKAIPPGRIRGAPAVHDGRVFFGALNNHFYAVSEHGNPDKSTNAYWVNQTRDIVWSSPAIVRGASSDLVVVGSYDERVYAFKTRQPTEGQIFVKEGTRERCWIRNATADWAMRVAATSIGRSQVHSSPAVDERDNDNDVIYVGSNSGRIMAFNRNGQNITGFDYARSVAKDVVISSPAIAGDYIIVGSDDRNLYFINKNNGTVAKTFFAGGQVKASPAVDGGRVVISSFDGATYMLGPKRPPRPDLMMDSLTYANGIVRVAVSNKGEIGAENVGLRILVDGAVVYDETLAPLGQGESRTIDHSPTLEGGRHAIIAHIDYASRIVETNEANNQAFYNVTVVVQGNTETATETEEGGSLPAGGLLAVLTGLGTALTVRLRRREE